jgi:4-alpha-glucanotransferase
MHITSLPSAFGIGDLGPDAYHFVELLAQAHQHYWSILPLSTTRQEDGNSPYQASSAFAGNPLMISPQKLTESGLLPKESLPEKAKPSSKVNFEEVYAAKKRMLAVAYANFKKTRTPLPDAPFDFEGFCCQNKGWLNDYALYTALRNSSNSPWYEWPPSLRKRNAETVARKEVALKDAVEYEKFDQYLFFSQFCSLKAYCRANHVRLVGDMPFYVTYDSADIWVHPELFSLNAKGKPRFVGGVPPDYFSVDGQLWGNPTYNWQTHPQTGFQWWLSRIRHNLQLFDLLRLDHFRGFVAYWQVPAKEKTAKKGRWVKTPSREFFRALKAAFPLLPFIAEDLGYIDEPVRQAIQRLGVPGMRVMLFGFDGDRGNPHLLQNHVQNSVVYTGTHDTNTVRGWFTHEASSKQKRNLFRLMGKKVSAREVGFEVVLSALSSVADLSIIPLQDVLGLGVDARMNNPGNPYSNWTWRATPKQLTSPNLERFGKTTLASNRRG